MIGFRLNPQTNDLEAVGGKINLLSTVQEAVRQRLSIKLKTYSGEWFLDTSYGVPYRGLNGIIGKGRSQQEVDAVFIDIINQDTEVKRITYFNSTYNANIRDYALNFEVKVDDRPLRDNNPSLSANDEVEYVFDNVALSPTCATGQIALSIRLHEILHFDLPQGGQYSWIYP